MFDISLTSKKHAFCNGWSRRDFIRVGALAPFGLSLGGLFSAQNSLAGLPSATVASAAVSRITTRST